MENPLDQLADLERRINEIMTCLGPFNVEQWQVVIAEWGLADQVEAIRYWKPKIEHCWQEQAQIKEALLRIAGLATSGATWAREMWNPIAARGTAVGNMYNSMITTTLEPARQAIFDWEEYYLKGPEGPMIRQMLRSSGRN